MRRRLRQLAELCGAAWYRTDIRSDVGVTAATITNRATEDHHHSGPEANEIRIHIDQKLQRKTADCDAVVKSP